MAGTTWVRLDVGYFRNRKIVRAGIDAALLHLTAICYLGSCEDGPGLLPVELVEPLAKDVRIDDPEPVVGRLVKFGLWSARNGDWLIHDYRTTNGDRSPAAKAKYRQRRHRGLDAEEPTA